ncbi:hypothetical protein LIER_28301 [Lithospermum erythrorhizon]|uniref:Uncharacterized protein n=1 Tax=Lithospermum erythrorhizon TaxID=34254 RepID=A0AAV3RGW4_LITER
MVNLASPSSFARPVVGLLSPMPSLEEAMHNALSLLLDQGIPRLLGCGFRYFAASTSRAVADGHTTLYHQTLDLNEELAEERHNGEALE